MVLYFTPFEDSKSAWLSMLTVQKVFSALKVDQSSFLTSANKKIGKEDFGFKQLLLAKSFELSELCFPLEELSPHGRADQRAGIWRQQCLGCCNGRPAPLQPQQHIAMSENGILWHTAPVAHLEEKM